MPAMPLAILDESSIHVGWVERRETHRTQAPSHQELHHNQRPRFAEGVSRSGVDAVNDGFRDRSTHPASLILYGNKSNLAPFP